MATLARRSNAAGASSPRKSNGARAPLTPKLKPMNYKTQLCSDFMNEYACARGDACNFAHGEEELRKPGEVKPEDFKTEEEMASERLECETRSPPDPGPRLFLRRDELFWIELDTSEEVPEQLRGLPMEVQLGRGAAGAAGAYVEIGPGS
eukprot:Skav231399  [mRNA]  locus=scaffold1456:160189:169217:- [translate_table: standard]